MSTLRENLDRLLLLQHLDSEREKTARQRPSIDTLNMIAAKVAAAQAEYKASTATLSQTNGALKDAELELAGLEKKIKDYESKMRQGLVTNTREVMNFEKEFNQLNRQRSALDDKILMLMDQSETQATLVANAQSKVNELDNVLKTAKTQFHNELTRVDATVGRLNTEREQMSSLVSDAALLKRYEALRAKPGKGGIGIARTTNNTCGACHMQVGTVSVTTAESGSQLTLCENCGRIMA
jgi:uncharacterized protein